MIFINGDGIKQEKFGDGTLKCNLPLKAGELVDITWAYDNDSELFTLACITDTLKEYNKSTIINLNLPYIPNARQDRVVSGKMFTLKTFCKLINNMGFDKVRVVDPHSAVSMALLNHLCVDFFCTDWCDKVDAIMFPDAGAAKKYQEVDAIPKDKPIIIGNKHRNSEGRIVDYELMNFPEGVKSILIKDDICSYGGTFVEAAKALRSRGVETIYLEVTHCEGNIFKGNLFDYVDLVITSDSILDLDHNNYEGVTEEKLKKLIVMQEFRR